MAKYDSRRENFVRQVSKAFNISVSESRLRYNEYQNSSDSQRRKIMKDVKNRLKDRYPARHPAQTKQEGKAFKYPKEKKQKGFKPSKGAVILPRAQRKTQVRNQMLLAKETKGHKTQSRVLKASKKYPSASKYELQHGVNSKASKRYRENQRRDK